MDAKTNAVTGAALKRAIETLDGRALTNFYADDAILQIVDRNNPPSKPRVVKGKIAIGTFWDDICSRAMTHKVETSSPTKTNSPSARPVLIPMARRYCVLPCASSTPARLRDRPSFRPGTSREHHQ